MDVRNDFLLNSRHNMAIGPTDYEKVIAGTGALVLRLPESAFWAGPGKKPLIIYISRHDYCREMCDLSF